MLLGGIHADQQTSPIRAPLARSLARWRQRLVVRAHGTVVVVAAICGATGEVGAERLRSNWRRLRKRADPLPCLGENQSVHHAIGKRHQTVGRAADIDVCLDAAGRRIDERRVDLRRRRRHLPTPPIRSRSRPHPSRAQFEPPPRPTPHYLPRIRRASTPGAREPDHRWRVWATSGSGRCAASRSSKPSWRYALGVLLDDARRNGADQAMVVLNASPTERSRPAIPLRES